MRHPKSELIESLVELSEVVASMAFVGALVVACGVGALVGGAIAAVGWLAVWLWNHVSVVVG